MNKRKIGKRIGGTTYIHRSAVDELPDELKYLVNQALSYLEPSFPFEVIKVDSIKKAVSFISSPDWNEADTPRVGDGYKIDPFAQKVTFVKARKENAQIYHHKWMFVRDDYQGFDVNEAKRRSKEWEYFSSLIQLDSKRMGNSNYWNSFVHELRASRGIWKFVVPIPSSLSWERGTTFMDALSLQPELFNGTTSVSDDAYKPHPTQIKKTEGTYEKMFRHIQSTSLRDDCLVLDASSGMGLGTEIGRQLGFRIDDLELYPPVGYLPKYRSYEELTKQYDYILCNMVLNVVTQDIRDSIVRILGTHLKVGGKLFFTVRGRNEIEVQPSGVPFNTNVCEYYFPSKRSYQKGFTKEEVVQYLKDALESDELSFDITPLSVKNSGVPNIGAVVTRC